MFLFIEQINFFTEFLTVKEGRGRGIFKMKKTINFSQNKSIKYRVGFATAHPSQNDVVTIYVISLDINLIQGGEERKG